MRLHRLRAEAFGPFAEAVEVDFDELSSSGLFLLSGATGAGKTSVLDAVAFALYGDVPGDRSDAKQLRSDQAAPHMAPSVELEVTLAGRRYRITRTAAWDRPKRRGSGTTRQQAGVSVAEHCDGAWQQRTTRMDEAGHLITERLGMTLTQFSQVAMLPQGRFQAFLRARSQERHALLQRLFRTGRHEDVERWLKERRLVLARAEQQARTQVGHGVNRISEAAGVALPWQPEEMAQLTPDAINEWFGLVRVTQGERLEEDATTARRAAHEFREREDDWQRATEQDRLRRAAEQAQATLRELAIVQPEIDRTEQVLAEGERLAVLVPLRNRARAARLQIEDRRRGAQDARIHLRAVHPSLTLGTDPDLLSAADDLSATLDSAIEVAEAAAGRLTERVATHRSAQASVTTLAETLDQQQHRLDALPQELQRVRDAVARARAAEVRSVELRAELLDAESIAQGARRVAELIPAAEQATTAWQLHERLRLDLKEAWLELRELRLAGIAAELASELSAGCACPVCGSGTHPSPAVAAAGRVTAEDERAARSRYEDAEGHAVALDGRVRELATRLEVARVEAAGVDAEQAGTAAAVLRDRLSEASELAGGRAAAEAGLAELANEEQDLATRIRLDRSRLETLLEDEQRATEAAEVARAAWDAARHDVLELLGSEPTEAAHAAPDTVLALARGHHRSLGRMLEACRKADSDVAEGEAVLLEREQALQEALLGTGFPPHLLAEAEPLDARLAEQHRARIRAHDESGAAARSVLADPAVQAALAVGPVDLATLSTLRSAARETLDRAVLAEQQARTSVQRIEVLLAELAPELDRWTPLLAEHALVAGVARLVDGSSPDNHQAMRLSAFVLQQRFTAVVDAANVRLVPMSDGRYLVEHSERRTAGENRGGLSLAVLDTWSGVSRDPATLSGGETFVVSLALALGLADVITAESGGQDLETLFVDEGFGALDAETLDDVMDTLDDLRAGGRVVGVVSHVAEMRDRIPTQLQISKARSGSSVRVLIG